MSFLTLSGVGKRYGDFVAVDALDLSIEKGEFVSLLGPSGCGKTTTLQMIAGFVQVTAGRITLDGKDITREKPNRRGLGIVFQSYALFPHMTVAANVAFGLEMRGISGDAKTVRVERALSLVRLSSFAHRYPRELSGGQRQRVALARALVIEPAVLLLDEPMSNLDAKLREAMQEELREIQRTVGTTTLMVTHDQQEALSMSDRVVVMNAGRAVQISSPAAAYDRPADAFVAQFVGRANLLNARVLACETGRTIVEANGLQWQLPQGERAFNAGDEVMCCVRPEKVRCVPLLSSVSDAGNRGNSAEGWLQIRGTVHSAMFLGDQWLHRVDTAHGALISLSPNAEGLDVRQGTAVELQWPVQAMHVIAMPSASEVSTASVRTAVTHA